MFQDFSSSWDIHATPTFFFLKDGKQLDKLVGANRPELEKKIVSFADGLAQHVNWIYDFIIIIDEHSFSIRRPFLSCSIESADELCVAELSSSSILALFV